MQFLEQGKARPTAGFFLLSSRACRGTATCQRWLGCALKGDHVEARVAHHRDGGFLAALNEIDLLGEHPAEEDDAEIARAQALAGPIRNPALGFHDNAVLRKEVAKRFVLDTYPRCIVKVDEAATILSDAFRSGRQYFREAWIGQEADPDDFRMRVVDRNAEVNRLERTLRHPRNVRKDQRRPDFVFRRVAAVVDRFLDSPFAGRVAIRHDRTVIVGARHAHVGAGIRVVHHARNERGVRVQIIGVNGIRTVFLDL